MNPTDPFLIRPGCWLIRSQLDDLNRADFQTVYFALLLDIKRPGKSTGEAEFSILADVDFPCKKVVIRKGARGTGVTAAYVTQFNDGSIVILFIKEGKNLSLRDLNDIREAYREEQRSRGDE